ncbi:MAG TPA: radical SAM protein [Candidatus Goldiibacteriota bacterium]|nr:radical SAM protein [Candidatus Goldiibacteriota bacterium]HPN63847.1 radical SAM protein [Candidatus Goldiibacteriota bacterium]HRQ43049.1 radical SAM protein [Candidatus Goldiibacteriota bacterium]
MRVLLINPEWIRKKGSIWKGVAGAMPPLGLAYIGAYLEKEGVQVSIIDMQVEYDTPENILKSLNYKPDFVGISAVTTTYNDGLVIAGLCRKIFPSARIIFGGVHPTFSPEEVLSHDEADYVIRGEGEETLLKLVKGEKEENIKGLSYKNEGRIIHNPDCDLIKDLDALPVPAYHMLRVERYVPSLGAYKRLPGISMITSRGCPGKCKYCFGSYLGNRIRFHSYEYMLKTVRMLKKDYGIKEIAFYDDTFTAFKNNLKLFCEGLINEKLDITWVCFARVDFIDAELLALMKKAGCHQVLYGVESGNQEILKALGKSTTLERVEEAVRMTKKAGIECRTSFMLGNPGDTEETLQQTIDFSIKLDADLAMYNITTPFPGTEMYKWAQDNGYLMTNDWSKYDFSTAVMNLPTVSPEKIEEYYHRAHRLFYGRPKYLIKRVLKIRTIDDVIMAFKAVIAIWFK